MQTDALDRGQRVYPTMLVTARKLYAAGGLGVFARGIVPCTVRAVYATALCFLGYEMAFSGLGGDHGGRQDRGAVP